MKKLLIIFTMLAFVMVSCSQQAKNGIGNNPFFGEWKTPFQVPPFDKIQIDHYRPAFDSAVILQKENIDIIVNNTDEPTFENTIYAYDISGELLNRVSLVFYGLNSANTNDAMQQLQVELSPILSKHSDDIRLNAELFKRIKYVYDRRNSLGLDKQQNRLVEEVYKNFERSGANLDSAKQARLRELNSEISGLQIKFGQNLLAETAAFTLLVDDENKLLGLSNDFKKAAADKAKASGNEGKWEFGLDNPTVMTFLSNADNRDLREKLWSAYVNRCNNNNDNDNKNLIKQLLTLRLERAKIMGAETSADFILEDRMARTPQAVYDLLNQVWEPALEKAKAEALELQDLINKDKGDFKLAAWDWRYYAQKNLQSKYDLTEEETKPYFQINNVRDGIFYVANKLYGITFIEIKDIPKPHEDATAFECLDGDGALLGIVYLDMYARPGNKRGGAWCSSYRTQQYKDGKRIAPIVTVVGNFSNPVGNKPALLSLDETETYFHEFGHALHSLFSDIKYTGIRSVPRDFVELPSQINEHWAFDPQVLGVYAKHYETGEIIPAEIVNKIAATGKIGQGFATTEYLASAFLDMDCHTLKSIPDNFDVLKFEADALNKKRGLLSQIPARHRSTYFSHTFVGGYTAGYYSYMWAEVLDADAYDAFLETKDIFNKKLAERFRNEILSKAGSEDAMTMYVNFRGAQPKIDALLRNRGLKE